MLKAAYCSDIRKKNTSCPQRGFDPGTFCTAGKHATTKTLRLAHYSIIIIQLFVGILQLSELQ